MGESRWPKVIGDLPSVEHAPVDHFSEFSTRQGDAGPAGRLRQQMIEIEPHREQILCNTLMQLLSDGRSFLLANRLEALRELANPPVRFAQIGHIGGESVEPRRLAVQS